MASATELRMRWPPFDDERRRHDAARLAAETPSEAEPQHPNRLAERRLLARLDHVLGGMRRWPDNAEADEMDDLVEYWMSCEAAARGDAPPGTPWRHQRTAVLSVVFVCGLSAAAVSMVTPYRPSVSQITDFFATSVPGYDEYQGIPVLERAQPEAETSGIRAGGFVMRPTIETGLGYDDNVLGGRGSPSSVISRTTPTLAVNSDWDRNALGAYLSADTAQYLNTPAQSRTDWNAALGGTYTIGRGDLTAAYSHLALHEDSTYLNAVPTSTPLPFTVEDFRASYSIKLGAFTLTPNIDLSLWRFGTATIGGLPVDERLQDHDVLQAGLAGGYAMSSRTNLLATLSVIDARYLYSAPNLPAPSAVSVLGLAGLDYRYSGALRMRVLLGAESRDFQSAAYRSRIAPVGQASVIWTPSGMTTITATLARSLEDAVQSDSGGYTYTRAELELDHELLRNVVLTSRIGVEDLRALPARRQLTDDGLWWGRRDVAHQPRLVAADIVPIHVANRNDGNRPDGHRRDVAWRLQPQRHRRAAARRALEPRETPECQG